MAKVHLGSSASPSFLLLTLPSGYGLPRSSSISRQLQSSWVFWSFAFCWCYRSYSATSRRTFSDNLHSDCDSLLHWSCPTISVIGCLRRYVERSFYPLRRPGSSFCTSSKGFAIAAFSSFSEDWFSGRWVLVLTAALLVESSHFLEESIEFDLITSSPDSTKKPRIAETFLSFVNSSLELGHSISGQLLEMNLANSTRTDAETNIGSPEEGSCSSLEPSKSWIAAKAEAHSGKSCSDLNVEEVCVKLEWIHCFPDSNCHS